MVFVRHMAAGINIYSYCYACSPIDSHPLPLFKSTSFEEKYAKATVSDT